MGVNKAIWLVMDDKMYDKLSWYARNFDTNISWVIRRSLDISMKHVMDALPDNAIEDTSVSLSNMVKVGLTESLYNDIIYYADYKRKKSRSWVIRMVIRYGLDVAMSATKERWEFRYDALKEAGKVK